MAVNEADPLFELREELNDEDEPLFGPPPTKPVANGTALPPPGPPPLPPPLPKKPTSATGTSTSAPPPAVAPAVSPPGRVPTTSPARGTPSAPRPPTGRYPAAPQQPAVQYQVTGLPTLPAMVQRPTGSDPFQEPPEPRLPPGADPEEKLRTFRAIIKGKDEALGRGRSLYGALDAESQQLRAIATQLRGQLEAAAIELQKAQAYPEQL
ncbi:MAG: hypothetical protein MUC96_11420, partial [Myxococcaceae bacterium]|nr:hypothetical protein [Myxococcaceae bacterium]